MGLTRKEGELMNTLVSVNPNGSEITAGSTCMDFTAVSAMAAGVSVANASASAVFHLISNQNSHSTSQDEASKGPLDEESDSPAIENTEAPKVPSTEESEGSLIDENTEAPEVIASDEKSESQFIHENTNDVHTDSSRDTTFNTAQRSSISRRAKLVYMTPQQLASHRNRLVTVQSSVGPVLFLPLHQKPPSSSRLVLAEESVNLLLQKCRNMSQEKRGPQ